MILLYSPALCKCLNTYGTGESSWWTIHPASKQRSEGEKVRVGDDLILVSVASERYLHIGAGETVMASFQQTLWTVHPLSSGVARLKSVGYVFGGDVLRLLHGDECLTIPQREMENVDKYVDYFFLFISFLFLFTFFYLFFSSSTLFFNNLFLDFFFFLDFER